MIGLNEGRVVDVQGDENAHNRGRLCIKGLLNRDILYVEDRALHPMVRVNGELRRATWDEAMEAAAEGFKASIEANGADSVAIETLWLNPVTGRITLNAPSDAAPQHASLGLFNGFSITNGAGHTISGAGDITVHARGDLRLRAEPTARMRLRLGARLGRQRQVGQDRLVGFDPAHPGRAGGMPHPGQAHQGLVQVHVAVDQGRQHEVAAKRGRCVSRSRT